MQKAAIILDKDNNWIEKFLPIYYIRMEIFSFKVFHNHLYISDFDFQFVLGFTKILKKD